MADQRITIPGRGMIFGDSTSEMINNALLTMPVELQRQYEPAVVMACPLGTKARLQSVWTIGNRHYSFASRHYGKVTFTRKSTKPEYVQISLL